MRQPWAAAILRSATDARWKTVENRYWREGSGNLGAARNIAARSSLTDPGAQTILLHAGARVGVAEFDDACDAILDTMGTVDCLRGIARSHIQARGARRGLTAWTPVPELYFGGIVGRARLILADVEVLPFVAFKGALGFFEVPDDLIGGAP